MTRLTLLCVALQLVVMPVHGQDNAIPTELIRYADLVFF